MSESRRLIIDLGLNPEEPMDWDREKSSVVDAETGEKIGFIDVNDGLRITVILEATDGRPTDGGAK